MKEVTIIGAGIAGMTAAMHLIEAGIKTTIIDNTNNIGGRCFSFYDKNINLELDNGQHVCAGIYNNFFQLISWLNSQDKFDFNNNINIEFRDRNSKIYKLDCSTSSSKFGVFKGIINLKSLSPYDKFNILKIIKTKNIYYNNDISVLELLKQKNQSSNSIKYFWEPIVLATLNTTLENSSAFLFLVVLNKFIFGSSNERNLIFFNSSFKDVFKNFTKKIYSTNNKILLGHRVKKVLTQNNKCYGIELNNGKIINSDFVIASIPPEEIFLLTENNTIVKNNFNYSAIISIYLLFDGIIMDNKFFCGIDTTIQWVFNKKIINNKQQLIAITISASNKLLNLSNKELIQLIINDINIILPNSKGINISYYRILRDKKATILINKNNNKLRNNTRTDIANFFLAGAWTNTELPVTIESAAKSGKLAAKEVLFEINENNSQKFFDKNT